MKKGSNKQGSITRNTGSVVLLVGVVLAFAFGVALPFLANAAGTTITANPTSVGPVSQWNGVILFVIPNSDKVADVKTDDGDGSYITSSTNNDKQTFVFEGAGVPDGATIQSVTLKAEVKGVGPGANKVQIIARNSAGSIQNAAEFDASGLVYSTHTYAMNINPFTGSAWTVSEVNSWTTSFGVQRTNSAGSVRVTKLSVEVTYTVAPVNHAPVAQDSNVTTNEDSAVNGTLSASDSDSNPLTYSVIAGPTNGTISDLNSSNANFTYTPDSNYNGADSFTFKANDGSLNSNTATYGITVTPVNDAPRARRDMYSIDEDTHLSVSSSYGVLRNDSDIDHDSLTAALNTNVQHGELTLNTDGSFEYTPEVDFQGEDSFTYTAQDTNGGTSNTVTVTICVNSENDVPVVQNDNYSVDEDSVLTVGAPGVLSNDTDVDADSLTAAVIEQPTKGTITFSNDGSFTYTPNANENGEDMFTYSVNDGTVDSSIAVVTICIKEVNDAPIAIAQSITTDLGTAVSATLVGSDIDSEILTYATTTSPAHGTISAFDAATGAFTYVPEAGHIGSDSFDFTVNDGALTSVAASVSITVNSVPENTQQACSDGIDNDGDESIDLRDSDCAQFVPQGCDVNQHFEGEGESRHCVDNEVTPPTEETPQAPAPTTPAPTGGNGPIAGSLGGGTGGSIFGGGMVLGASTSTVSNVCTEPLLHDYMRMGKKNDPEQVKLLQQFLNDTMSASLTISGIFGRDTDSAVRAFQKSHEAEVLTPWGIKDPTGYVYKTTLRAINLIACDALNIPMPELN